MTTPDGEGPPAQGGGGGGGGAGDGGGGGDGGHRRRRRRGRGGRGGGGGEPRSGEVSQQGRPLPADRPQQGQPRQDRPQQGQPRQDRPQQGQPRQDRPQGQPRQDRPQGQPRQDRPQGQQARDERGPRRDDRGPRRDERGPRRDDRGPRRDDRGPRRDDRGPRHDDRARAEARPFGTTRTDAPPPSTVEKPALPATPAAAPLAPLASPSAELDAGWGTLESPAEETPSPERARAVEAEVVRTLTPPRAVEPRDPDGEDVFLGDEQPLPPGAVANVAGVKFRDAGTIYEFDAGDASYLRGARVVVESDRGPLVGTVAVGSRRLPVLDPLRRILRHATASDEGARDKNAAKEREAYLLCKQRIRDRALAMKLVRVEYPLSGGKVLFYFASEERVDFRDLVKDLAAKLHARIEMRQIGARDEAKMVGGIGSCGRELCCSTWLPAFVPVSIKMAKDQGLVLNPSKVSGQCGRLKCCLVYEHDLYKEMRKGLPKVGKRVNTPAGTGKVVELDVLGQKVRVWFDEGGSEIFPPDVLEVLAPPPQLGKGGRLPVTNSGPPDDET